MKTYNMKNGFKLTRSYLDELEQQGLSELEIADRLGITRMGLFKIRRKMNWPQRMRSDKGKYRVDPEVQRERRNAYMREYAHAKNIKYKTIRVGNKVMSLHRWKAEQALGRPLKKGEVVHHIDGNRLNNENSNLLICTQEYHIFLHKRMKMKELGLL